MDNIEKKVLVLVGGALAVDDRLKKVLEEKWEAKGKAEKKHLERRARALNYQLRNLGSEWIKAFGGKK